MQVRRHGWLLLVVLLLAGAFLPALGALPSPGQMGSPAQLGSPLPLMWTPAAEVTVGAPLPVGMLDNFLTGGDSFGPFYILKAPSDGIIDYLYSWTGFFTVGEPLARFYDAKLRDDLRQARAVAGKFNAQPYIVAGLAARGVPALPLVLGFPAPTTAPVAPATVLPRPGPAPASSPPTPSPGRGGGADDQPAASSRAQLTPARKELAVAEQQLASTDQELAARRQLQESGVLAPEEVARFVDQRNAAAAAVSTAQRKLQQAEAAPSRGAATGAPLPLLTPPPMALPAVPAIPAPPAELLRLSLPRWEDLFAPTGGLVLRPMVPPGTMVKKGTPILKVINSGWAHLRLVVASDQALRFDRTLPVTVAFPEVPGLRLAGWVTGKRYAPGDNRVVVDLLVTWPEEPYQTQAVLLAMAYASPPAREAHELELAVKPSERATSLAGNPFFSLVPTLMVASQARDEAGGQDQPLVGRVALVPPVPQFGPAVGSDPQAQDTLTQLHDWQTSFVDGMTTAIYNQKLLLSYPRSGEMSQVVEKMMKGEVEHDPGYCARTLRLALGWGLGDAYNWAVELPKRGWLARDDGLPRPGDILVWPFTYGRNHSQHIGVAVRQNGQMMLLSNLGGRLGTSDILGGYLSFYKPTTPTTPGAVPLPPAMGKR